jgi:predicted secreted protein
MADWKDINASAASAGRFAKSAAEDAAKALAQVEGLAKLLAQASEASRVEASEAVDWTKPIPALTPRQSPTFTAPWPRDLWDVARMSDETVADAQAKLDAYAKEAVETTAYNSAVFGRWRAMLAAHGVGMEKRTSVPGLVIDHLSNKHRVAARSSEAVEILRNAAHAVTGGAGPYQAVDTVAKLRDHAKWKIAIDRAERNRIEAIQRAEAEKREAAEAARLRTEAENVRLREELARRLPPSKPAPAPAAPVTSAQTDRFRMIEIDDDAIASEAAE